MKWTLFAFMLMFVSFGCGKKVDTSGKEKSVSNAEALINKRKYEQAIAILEPIAAANPGDERIEIKLFHALAGAGTFEALEVIDMWKKMERELNKKDTEKVNQRDLGLMAKSFQAKANRILAPLPDLTAKQSQRLDQAIDLYQKLGNKVETAGSYSNFKWGTLHIYRLALNAKKLLKEIGQATSEKSVDRKKIETAVLSKISIIGQDIFMAYRLFGNSYDNIKKLTDSIDKMISKAVDDRKFKLRINETVVDQAEFFHNILADNISAASILVKKIGDLYSGDSLQSNWRGLLNVLPSNQQVTESEQNIISLVRLFLRTFAEKHPEFEEKVRGLFNEEFKTLLTNAANESIRVKNMDPLQEFFESKRNEVQVIVSYYRVLRKEISESDLSEEIRAQIEPLTKKLQHDSLQENLQKLTDDINQEKTRLEGTGRDQVSEKLTQMLSRKDEILSQLGPLRSYLGPSGPIGSAANETLPEPEAPVSNSEQEDQEPSEEPEEESTDETNDLVE